MKSSCLPELLVMALFLVLTPVAVASNTWYVDGVNGNDNNDCMTSQTACQTIGHAIALASSGDSIMVAPATYIENLTIDRSLKIIGSDAATTIVDGKQAGTVFTISSTTAHVRLSKLTIRNGLAEQNGGGINNSGTLTINNSTIIANIANESGGGIENVGALTIDKCAVSGNDAVAYGGGIENNGTMRMNRSTVSENSVGYYGGGIFQYGNSTINNSTISGNRANDMGGGIEQLGNMTINNSTISGNRGYYYGGGIDQMGSGLTINNSTISGNSAYYGGGIGNEYHGKATLQNTIVANSPSGGNCYDTVTSNGYNLSSDDTCNFSGPGDMNNTKPKFGTFGNHGGPTQTVAIRSDSPAVDAGNPNGCTDDKGNLLMTDQRGKPRPGKYKPDKPCDIGAYERQKD